MELMIRASELRRSVSEDKGLGLGVANNFRGMPFLKRRDFLDEISCDRSARQRVQISVGTITQRNSEKITVYNAAKA